MSARTTCVSSGMPSTRTCRASSAGSSRRRWGCPSSRHAEGEGHRAARHLLEDGAHGAVGPGERAGEARREGAGAQGRPGALVGGAHVERLVELVEVDLVIDEILVEVDV